MCGRFGLTKPDRLDLERFGIDHLPTLVPRFNIPPGERILAIRVRDGTRSASLLKWGLVPWWSSDPSIGHWLANARGDTAFEKASFRDPMRKRRCLIPADLFYEWQAVPGRRKKRPYVIRLRSEEPFALGGIWDFWRPASGGDGLATCAILTTASNVLLSPVHDRMPVIVRPERYSDWLDFRTPASRVQQLMQPYPSEEMILWPIGLRVNSANEDDAALLDREAEID